MRHLLYIIPTLIALWLVDNALSDDRRVGWERNSVRNATTRWERLPKARVAIFGSSTSKDWLPVTLAAQVTGVSARDVVDAHINGCHQGCTSTIRQMKARKQRYEIAFFGTNLFQLCEEAHSKRVMQQEMQLPATDVPLAFTKYLHAEQPLRYMGRFIGMGFSGAYADTAPIQRALAEDLFGKTDARQAHRWYREVAPVDPKLLSCRYEPEDVAYKRAMTEALLDDLGEMSERVFLMLLPDRTLALDDPEFRERWRRHIAMHHEIAAARPWVTIVDLVDGGVSDPAKYRDGFHLTPKGMTEQRALFEARMAALGWPPPKPGAKPAKVSPEPPKVSPEPPKVSPEPSKVSPDPPKTSPDSPKASPEPSKPSPLPSPAPGGAE
ncbi:MAG: SGNH/GDSL hydrolase family protein [bacterium]